MIGKLGMWGSVTTSGGALICAAVLAGWWLARTPHSISAAPPQRTENLAELPPAPQLADAKTSAPADKLPPLRIDIFQIAPNGDVVVAGGAAPGAKVALLDAGEILLETRADPATGEFVLVPPRLSAGAHRLSLRGSTSSNSAEMQERALPAFSIAPQIKAAKGFDLTSAARMAGQAEPRAAEPGAPRGQAKIARGDTLWRVSRDRLGRGALYPTIYQANSTKIRDPNRIYPDQILTIP
jgi:nucleoid-associated protein YgaU